MSFIALHVLRVGVPEAVRHAVEVALHELLAQLVHQLLELLLRLRRRPLVLLQRVDLTGEVGWKQVELQTAGLRGLLGDLLATLIVRGRRLLDHLVDAFPLGVDDVAQPVGDLVEGASEVVPLERVAPPAVAAARGAPAIPGCARRCRSRTPTAAADGERCSGHRGRAGRR